MAAAENINTLYIYNLKHIRQQKRDINKLVYAASVFFEKCDFIVKGNYRSDVLMYTNTSAWMVKVSKIGLAGRLRFRTTNEFGSR